MAYKKQNTADSVRITYDKGVSPVWARLLHKGVENRGKLKSTLRNKITFSPGKKTQLGFKLDKKNPLLSVNMKF